MDSCVGTRDNMDNEKQMHMSHELLKEITDSFSDERILSRGTFGVVYKGENKDGQEIAVKVLKLMKGVDDNEFRREFNNLTKLKHPNIVQLVGFCNETEEVPVEFEGKEIVALRIHRALCFEYMRRGSLQKHLSEEYHGFDWRIRYRIIKGICEGLKYLHEGLEEPIFHLDLKPDNILLDTNMMPKIADFGMSRLLGEENTNRTIREDVGTHGYIPPEYIKNQVISKEFDIFSLGVIIIKIITGPTGHSRLRDMEPAKFVEHVCNKWRERPQGEPGYSQQVKTCTEIALMCTKEEKKDRPTIGCIVDQLDKTEEHQNDPPFSINEFDDRETITPNSDIPARPSPALKSSEMVTDPSGGKSPENNQPLLDRLPQELPLKFLKEITNGFSEENKITEGTFGTLYKGNLEDGKVIAVKKLAENTAVPAGKQFLKEVTNLMLVRHKNILKLLSCCSEGKKEKVVEHKGKYILVDTDEYILCYEYAPKGSLRRYLSDGASRIDWATYFKIIKGICQGLHFLHQEMGAPIVHMDLQPTNILLDDNMVPKIADFGLSRFFGQEQSRMNTITVVGVKGYMAPEYIYSGEISPQCDIYSLGVLILEITTGEKNSSSDKDMAARNFITDIRETWTDEHIASKYSSLDADKIQEVKTCIEIGLECVDVAPKNRPSIVEIVERLNRRRGI